MRYACKSRKLSLASSAQQQSLSSSTAQQRAEAGGLTVVRLQLERELELLFRLAQLAHSHQADAQIVDVLAVLRIQPAHRMHGTAV